MLTGCSGDKYSKKAVCDTLFCDYLADCDFTISSDKLNISGKAKLVRGDFTSISIYEPLEYDGITISSDETGNSDTFCLELSGIPSALPKSIASDLSLMFSLFTDTIPSKISSLEDDAFEVLNNASQNIRVSFTENGMNYSILYDMSGIPSVLKAGNDKTSIEITLNEFTIIKQQ